MWLELRVAGLFMLAASVGACSKKPEQVAGEQPSKPMAASSPAPPAYVGSAACARCHEEANESWRGSHHDLAMQEATPETVLGDFDAKVRYHGEVVRFSRKGDDFFVEALDAEGKRRRFPTLYTFGVEPLQQYLLEVEPGRLQAFAFAWDTRPKGQGGQRWFHLQPGERIEPGDPLHWTGPSYNWNHACADCHSTALQKSYDRGAKRYSTEYVEIDVGCEACHGPGSRHVEIAETHAESLPKGAGLERHFAGSEDRIWSFVDGRDIAVLSASRPTDEPEACAPCHSRRADLGGMHLDYHDRYRLALLDELLYFDDGQIKDEVYVYGSFLQSKMHAAGVICTDCHDAHGTDLRAQGNALCTRCHRADAFDGPEHHFHEAGGPGSLCTDCHMPQRTYMVVDDRADHRFGLPRPALAERVGAPDACTTCHRDRTARWADQEIAKRFGARSADGFAEAFHAARRHEPHAEQGLIELVAAGTAPSIVRATALVELRNLASPALPTMLMRASNDPSPLVRRAVAVAARDLPPAQRVELVRPLLRDSARTVRVEAVAASLGMDVRPWSERDREALKKATVEYLEARSHNADRAEGLVDLAHVAALAGDFEHAEENLREALDLDPTFTAAYVNLADLYRSQGREQEVETLLRRGLAQAADQATVELALGLTLVRLDRHADAVKHLQRAHALRPESVRFGYVYAVALYDQGRRQAALRTLEEMQRRYPGNRDILRLLVAYNRQLDRTADAERYATLLEELGGEP